MKLYRFSPIGSKDELIQAISHTHFECYKLCKQSFGKYLTNAGNIGIFCHYEDEFQFLTNIRKELTESTDNYDQKYFKLHEPIIIDAKGDIPETVYSYLYIRRPDPYRSHVGDVDFYLPIEEYQLLKQQMQAGRVLSGARVFDRPDLDMIELYDPDVDVLGYVSTETMTETVRIKQSKLTKL
jgi:hypothetical protein